MNGGAVGDTALYGGVEISRLGSVVPESNVDVPD